jgi:hypothetical protein
MMKILVINPGSTSTKLSLFEDDTSLFEESEFHDAPILLQYPSVNDQVSFRKQVVLNILRRNGYAPASLHFPCLRLSLHRSGQIGKTDISSNIASFRPLCELSNEFLVFLAEIGSKTALQFFGVCRSG